MFFKELLVFGYGFGHCFDYCFQWEQGTKILLASRELVALVIKVRRDLVRNDWIRRISVRYIDQFYGSNPTWIRTRIDNHVDTIEWKSKW